MHPRPCIKPCMNWIIIKIKAYKHFKVLNYSLEKKVESQMVQHKLNPKQVRPKHYALPENLILTNTGIRLN